MKDIAKILLSDDEGSILLLTRSASHPRFAGHPDLPGGEVENGEDPTIAVIREVAEETGLSLEPSTVQIVSQSTPENRLHVVLRGAIKGTKPTPLLSWEHSEYCWLSEAELLAMAVPDGVDPYYSTVLRYLRS